jgi:RNA 3'-terminal phosphate cyclase (ATP)
VALAAKGGSAGSVSLILQAVLLPLALAVGPSRITLRGGTHVAWSPPFDYLKRVYLPIVARMGIQAKTRLVRWGWYPIGSGEVQVTVEGVPNAGAAEPAQKTVGPTVLRAPANGGPVGATAPTWTGLDLRQRGALLRVRGISASSNLPKHIRVRQEQTALHMLRAHGLDARIDTVDAPSKGQGTAVFLWAEFENSVAGFTALGERGKPAERVATEAVQDLLDYLHSGAALDQHLADQLVLPLALASGASQFSTQRVTDHLLTNASLVNQFLPGRVEVDGPAGQPGMCRIGDVTG